MLYANGNPYGMTYVSFRKKICAYNAIWRNVYHRTAERHSGGVPYMISVTSLGFQGALQKENYRLLSVFENFAAKRLDISFRFRQAVLEILFER
mgnify:CR=1 FL=1